MAAASATRGDTFVVVKIGARYAPWAMRAVKAAEMIGRSAQFHVIALEPLAMHIAWIHEHFQMNGMGPGTGRHKVHVVQDIFCGMPYNKSLPQLFADLNFTAPCTAELLKDVDHVDFLDIDAQGSEALMLAQPHDRKAFRRKVRRVHIELHRDDYYPMIAAHLESMDFEIVQNATWMYSAYQSEAFGLTYWRGGVIYAFNRALVPC